jgi:hypothetical protein
MVLCLDYRQNGIGSNSCGPELLGRYKLAEEGFQFDMKLIPNIRIIRRQGAAGMQIPDQRRPVAGY